MALDKRSACLKTNISPIIGLFNLLAHDKNLLLMLDMHTFWVLVSSELVFLGFTEQS